MATQPRLNPPAPAVDKELTRIRPFHGIPMPKDKTLEELHSLQDHEILSLESHEIPIEVAIEFVKSLYRDFHHPLPLRRGSSTHGIGDANQENIGTTTHGHTAFTLIFLQRHFLPIINSLQVTIAAKDAEICS